MSAPFRILHVEDNPKDAELIRAQMVVDGLDAEVVLVSTQEAYLAALEGCGFHLILCDYSLPGFDGKAALALAKQKCPEVPFLYLSGTIGEERAIECLKAGAMDYVLKDRPARLVPSIRHALHTVELEAERKRAAEEVHRLAYYDPLTGLPNRTLLAERLGEAIRAGRETNSPLALLLLDLDRFKDINDTLGHENGNHLLQQVAQRLQEALPQADTLARLGGDEFAAILRGTDAGRALTATHAILRALEQPFTLEGLSLDVRASIGVAVYPGHGEDATILLQRADVAMYLAKGGHDGYAIYSAERDQYNPRRLALIGNLRQALTRDEFTLHYQPEIELPARRVCGLEALIRWRHPKHGMVPPDQFIPLAEHTGLIKPLTLWVLQEALREFHGRYWEGLRLRMSVNLSARNLADPQLLDQVAWLMETWGIPPDSLVIEITESTLMADPKAARDRLLQLRNMGLQLSIDDFGTGYSSLSYLKTMPANEIKIDKSFIIGGMRDQKDVALVRSTIELGHSLGFKVMAEGVENEETLDRLIEFGCDLAQGYHISRPLPADALTAWLKTSPWGPFPL
jgi:diguanylate cyclase (GGDEF)-like protein